MIIQASKTEENIYFNYGEVNETDLEKLKDIAEDIFPILCNSWNCDDITFRFVNNKKIIDTFRLWS
jgi:hypothetical protein